MAEDTTTTTTTTTNTAQQLTMSPAQPTSHLHGLPQELQEMIFSFVVVSPTPIPARINLKEFETSADNTYSNSNSSGSSSTAFTTRVKISPSQPALSRVDKQTRATVLRIFYTQNTFLFRGHRYQSGPLHKWLTATAQNYAPEARLLRRVMFETSVRKTCGAASTPAGSDAGEQHHLYRMLVSAQPGDEGVRVRFGADLAVMCSCAMRTAGLLKAAPPSQSGIFHHHESSISAALSFAQDVECELVLMPNCAWQFCDKKKSSACRDCGLRVHGREPIGHFLLETARKQVREEAERREREKAREEERLETEREWARIEAERKEVREAERLERERESAARWEVHKAELDASLELLTSAHREKMRGEEMDRKKKHEEKKQGKAPAESRCQVM